MHKVRKDHGITGSSDRKDQETSICFRDMCSYCAVRAIQENHIQSIRRVCRQCKLYWITGFFKSIAKSRYSLYS